MNNKWNTFIYKLWAPVYDQLFTKGPFLKARRQIFSTLSFHPGEKVLLAGVGTGADLAHIPQDLDITAIDYSQEMLDKAKSKFPDTHIQFIQMDAQDLKFEDDTFDWVIGSLILTVVPDGGKALTEMVRVSKKGGQIIIFDKFIQGERGLSLPKKMARPLIRLLGTDIGLSFETLTERARKDIFIKQNKGILFNGMYRSILLQKKWEKK
ncbi:phosphatidylethanolamine N-methyltransferase [Bacillus sp. FJAT-27225]|uniref:class I SAM-dependent methyltransferase n=1 Tax=Bacillus sp. FJAT-27225 TaxID=1743144 RepID=UPI00080C2997|nr:methyltransferase domain-containing protein [Bacillus sp. FJAT-27225]OCA84397.1 phosphatidylethanolamine N-methyltransferase [Bacillus sp. FJAT-27225]